MPDTKPVAKNSLVTTRRTCPLCESKSRREIDMLCASFRSPESDDDTVNGEVVDYGTGEITDAGDAEGAVAPETVLELEADIRELLGKLRDDKTEFVTSDLIIHLTQHTLVQEFSGLQIRSEGNYLIVGSEVFQKIDLKDSLNFFILKGLEQIASGKMKMTAAAWINANALLWRMMGNLGADEFIQAMIQKTQKGEVDATSPLGASYIERQEKLAQAQTKETQEKLARELEDVETVLT